MDVLTDFMFAPLAHNRSVHSVAGVKTSSFCSSFRLQSPNKSTTMKSSSWLGLSFYRHMSVTSLNMCVMVIFVLVNRVVCDFFRPRVGMYGRGHSVPNFQCRHLYGRSYSTTIKKRTYASQKMWTSIWDRQRLTHSWTRISVSTHGHFISPRRQYYFDNQTYTRVPWMARTALSLQPETLSFR